MPPQDNHKTYTVADSYGTESSMSAGVVPCSLAVRGPTFCPPAGYGSLTHRMSPARGVWPALSVIFLLNACGVTRSAPPTEAARAPIRHVLSNGARVIVQDFRSSDMAAVQLWVRAGGRDEAASELGLAHYLEHMLFKGTTTRPKGFVDRDVEGIGGRMNAGTSLDFTFYYAVLPSRRVLATIEMLADIGVNSILDETELELEKKVVLEEMRL